MQRKEITYVHQLVDGDHVRRVITLCVLVRCIRWNIYTHASWTVCMCLILKTFSSKEDQDRSCVAVEAPLEEGVNVGCVRW